MQKPKEVYTGSYVKRILRNHKYYVIGVWNGKVVDTKRWSNRTRYKEDRVISISKSQAEEIFHKNHSFDSEVKRVRLAKLYETTDMSMTVDKGKDRKDWRGEKRIRNAKVPKSAKKYQWVCEGNVHKDGLYYTVTARSKQHDVGYPLSKARDEAFERFLYKLTESRSGKYIGDVDDGWHKFGNVDKFKEGVVYYQAA